MPFTSKTSWRSKLEKPQERKVFDVPPAMQKRCGSGRMLIPRPLDVDAAIRLVPKGKLVTQGQLRTRLARDAGADVSCPITTGIFVRICSEAAEEDFRNGRKRVTPYWRVVRDDGTLIEKFPGGPKAQTKRLADEGIQVEPGKRGQPRVTELERHLVRWPT
ncbi:MAG: MGMT family protein [Planctomycetales bacterium]|nr:MGMT family protein [Planctomycetales bacterium]